MCNRVRSRAVQTDVIQSCAAARTVNVQRIIAVTVRDDRSASTRCRDQVVTVPANADRCRSETHRDIVLATTYRDTTCSSARRNVRVKSRRPVLQRGAVPKIDRVRSITKCNIVVIITTE